MRQGRGTTARQRDRNYRRLRASPSETAFPKMARAHQKGLGGRSVDLSDLFSRNAHCCSHRRTRSHRTHPAPPRLVGRGAAPSSRPRPAVRREGVGIVSRRSLSRLQHGSGHGLQRLRECLSVCGRRGLFKTDRFCLSGHRSGPSGACPGQAGTQS